MVQTRYRLSTIKCQTSCEQAAIKAPLDLYMCYTEVQDLRDEYTETGLLFSVCPILSLCVVCLLSEGSLVVGYSADTGHSSFNLKMLHLKTIQFACLLVVY